MVTKADLTIRSGAQTGADIAGLRAARRCNIKTMGAMPKGFKTLKGNRPEYAKMYGCYETSSTDYKIRTTENVEKADVTWRFAHDFESPGERCTMNAIKLHHKPWVDFYVSAIGVVRMRCGEQSGSLALPELAHSLIVQNEWKHINIAGNSESTFTGIERIVEEFLVCTFRIFDLNVYKD